MIKDLFSKFVFRKKKTQSYYILDEMMFVPCSSLAADYFWETPAERFKKERKFKTLFWVI
jgi:hypothetical protein